MDGSFQEGTWDGDKLTGPACRIYDATTGDLYSGGCQDGKCSGKGRLYESRKDTVYEGEFENNMKNGEGTIYQRDGTVIKSSFRNNNMDGDFEKQKNMMPQEIFRVFNNARQQNGIYISVQKKPIRRNLIRKSSNTTNQNASQQSLKLNKFQAQLHEQRKGIMSPDST